MIYPGLSHKPPLGYIGHLVCPLLSNLRALPNAVYSSIMVLVNFAQKQKTPCKYHFDTYREP